MNETPDREERLEAVRRELRRRQSDHLPDHGFSARVVARLPLRRRADAMGWAALKLLPAALAVSAALAWVLWSETGPAVASVEETLPSDDLLAWVLDDTESFEP